MSHIAHGQHLTSAVAARFEGFRLPTSNTTYTPNQFFDVCLPHYSRGVVRLVAYVIRKTLGWCDAHGNPQSEQHRISFNELERNAGISRDMIRSAVDEAIAGHFIRRVQLGAPNCAGKAAQTAVYELVWDEKAQQYIKDPTKFRGFFAGEGNRTYIPNQFFDVTVRKETLAVVKVVGSIVRFSIGFQNKFGHRRQQVALSYRDIQNYARIRNRATLSESIRLAVRRNYIHCVEQGYFDKDAGRLSHPATYSLRWLNPTPGEQDGQKIVPGLSTPAGRSEKRTGNGQKTEPERRSEKRTDIQIKQGNKTFKQHEPVPSAAILEVLTGGQIDPLSVMLLIEQGFDEPTARSLALNPLNAIRRQIDWLPLRRPTRNKLGMLRRAIEQDWPEPTLSLKSSGDHVVHRESGATVQEVLNGIRRRFNYPHNPSST
jgi:hypothetical protein